MHFSGGLVSLSSWRYEQRALP